MEVVCRLQWRKGAKHLGQCGHCLSLEAVGSVLGPGLFGAGMRSGHVGQPAAEVLTAWSHCGTIEEIRGTSYRGHLRQVHYIDARD